jgi:hypothetical protein
MSSGVATTGESVPSLWREVCDKCGTPHGAGGAGLRL